MALVIRDKPFSWPRIRQAIVYRLGAVPRGETLAETYVEPAVAAVGRDVTALTLTVLDRLDRQDRELAGMRSDDARTRIAMRELAQQLRLGCDQVSRAAEILERLSDPEWRRRT